MIKILTISGSLRKASSNTAMLNAAGFLASKTNKDIEITLYSPSYLEAIPHFNPDRETSGDIPEAVINFRNALVEADGILIASPEYVGGVVGALKNAFDWMIGSFGLDIYQKPFAIINISSRATKSYEDWKVIIRTMGGNLIEPASLHIPLPNNTVTVDSIINNFKLSNALCKVIQEFGNAILIGNTQNQGIKTNES